MYPISNAVKALFESEQRQILRITGTDKNGTAINITDADVVIDSFNIDRYSCNGEKLEIGTAIAAEMTLKLDNHDGRFNGIVFEGTELFVEIGIADWTQSNPTINWIPCGYFTPDEQPRSLNIITIHALDRMMQFDATMPTLTPWVTQGGEYITDSQGNIIYFVSNVRFPVTVKNLVERVAMLCGVPFTQSLTSLPNYNYTLSALPTLQQEITFRNLIQWCAGIMGANAWIDWTGSLRFSWYGVTTGYTSTTANRFSSDLHEDNITITGVTYTNMQGVSIVSGTPEYALDMTGNYMAANGISTILPNVKNRINGFTYRPFTASVINAPYLWPMDMITFNKDGVNHTCAVTNVNFGINGTTELAGKGETAQTNSSTSPGGVTKEQGFLIEQAHEATTALDQSLNQEGIFNRLTDNGETQGLILYDGKVYLNASYIQTGTMVADFINGGTLTLGGLNNTNGVLQVLDASGNVIGIWNNDGITLNKGTISGPSVTLGGNNNSDGVLTVKDANGNVIGTWNNDGVNISSGDIYIPFHFYIPYTNYDGYTKINGNEGLVCSVTGAYGTIEASFTYGELNIHGIVPSSGVVYQSMGLTPTSLSFETSKSQSMGPFKIPNINLKYGNRISNYGCGYIEIADTDKGHSFNLQTNGGTITWTGSYTVSGTKSRRVLTDQYSDRLLYCYETPTPMFGDIGEGVIGEDGLCYISLDAVFAQTVVTHQYQVFLQRYGEGECWVRERNGAYFIVQGTPGLAFGWEIKAKQRDYDQLRLERADEPFTVPEQSYGAEAAQYINDLMKERISE